MTASPVPTFRKLVTITVTGTNVRVLLAANGAKAGGRLPKVDAETRCD